MVNEIKVGDWIRTDNGIIGKYVKYRGIEDTIETNNKWIGFDIEKDIVKHSPNLIDIIEENDIGIMNCYGLIVKKFITMDDIFGLKTKEYKLLEILTKEQFEQISYKVKE